MEYNVIENRLPVYYSTMSGITNYPYYMLHGTAMDEPPFQKLHYHSVPEIGICVQGSGECQIGDKVYRFKKGDIQIIRPFVPHYATCDVGVTARLNFFTFDTVKLMQLMGISDPEKIMLMKSIEIPFNRIFAPDEYPEITALIQKIIDKCETSDDYTDVSVAFSIGEFLFTCRQYEKQLEHLPEEKIIARDYHRISPAIYHINMNLDDSSKLNEAKLAEVCSMSVSNFRRLFKLETGISPKAFVIKSRMAYAEYLLKNTDMTVIKIAESVGSNEVCGFNKIFASVFKTSPRNYRKQYK